MILLKFHIKSWCFVMVYAIIVLMVYTFWQLKNEQYGTGSLSNLFHNISKYNIWLMFARISDNSPLRYKFLTLVKNLLNVSSVKLHFHVIVDDSSHKLAVDELTYLRETFNPEILFTFYNISKIVLFMKDIVTAMTPHFSSVPGTYYSDASFYLSLGLYRFAPIDQDNAILLDCDLYFKEDVALLFEEFNRFNSSALFGLAPELSPVYRHVLEKYKIKHETVFGEFYHTIKNDTHSYSVGYQGYNSGIVLLNIKEIRNSPLYPLLLTNSFVSNLTRKYLFRGHLGDQDFFTLIGYEYPELIHTLNCGFNRQLCTWWKDHGYKDVFYNYSKCEQKIVVLHGNCNTPIPVH